MPSPEPLTVLLASDQAEEIKRITISLRSFYPGCRVEAVYSEDEALEWASKEEWHVLLLDECLPPRGGPDALLELRRRASTAALIVLTETSEPSMALQVIRGGADCALYRKSAGFLAELMVMVREVLEKREYRVQRDLAQGRYLRLVELLPDLVYELDAEGRFVFLSQSVVSLLGYSPEDLIGAHYGTILQPADRPFADHRFNERRTGARATTSLRVRLVPKSGETEVRAWTTVEISAKGLYDRGNRLVGTVGIARMVAPVELQEVHPLRHPQRATTEADHPASPPPPAHPLPAVSGERRRAPRFELPIEAKLTHEGTTWTGSVFTISLSGTALEFDGMIPSRVGQMIHLGLVSAIAVLHLRGIVRTVRELDRRRIGARVFPGTGLVVEFTDPTREERMVLGSLLEGLQDRSISASLTVLPHPAGEQGVMVEATAELIESAPRVPLKPFPPDADSAHAEHRFGTRVNFAMPVRLQDLSHSFDGRTLNLSLTGACLRVRADRDLQGRRVVLECAIPPLAHGREEHGPADPVPCRVRAEVAWTFPDRTPLPTEPAAETLRMGVRFLHLDEDDEQLIRNLVAGLLTYPLRIHGSDSTSKLLSTFVACRNQKDLPLAAFYDRPRKPLPPGAPLVVIAPDFGETKRDYVFLAYALACNGFHVLRCDYTEHVGESAGEMARSTLSGMRKDLGALLQFAANSWPASPLVLIAAGLAGRVALKATADQEKVRLLILLASVFDVRAALRSAHGEDLVGAHLTQPQAGLVSVLGLNVDGERWLGDLIQADYADLASTVRDAGHVATSTILFAADQDPRTPFAAVKEVQTALGSHAKQAYRLPDPGHRLHEDAHKDRALYRQIVVECLEHCYPAAAQEELQPPPLREVDRQRRLELDRLLARPTRGPFQAVDLLAEARTSDRSPGGFADHWRLLDDVYRLMGRFEDAQRVLDATCGAGQFGKVLLINQAYHMLNASERSDRPPLYVGIAPESATISRARVSLGGLTADLQNTFAGHATAEHFLRPVFGVVAPHKPLPFNDGAFDRVVCAFAVNSLLDPLFCVRELIRVLAPGGKVVLASLRPHADFTRLYRNVAADAQHQETVNTAKRLLAGWGAVAEAEGNGTLRMFDANELVAMLKLGGAVKPQVHPTLANQAYVAVAEKPTG